jgi:hypothetical protein
VCSGSLALCRLNFWMCGESSICRDGLRVGLENLPALDADFAAATQVRKRFRRRLHRRQRAFAGGPAERTELGERGARRDGRHRLEIARGRPHAGLGNAPPRFHRRPVSVPCIGDPQPFDFARNTTARATIVSLGLWACVASIGGSTWARGLA